jgi:hypothetical protein
MNRRALLLIGLAVLLLHGVLFWLDRGSRPLVGDERRYVASAEALARGESPPADLLWPPLHARLLGFVFAATSGSKTAVIVLQTLLLLASALLLRDLAARLTGPGAGADLVGLLLLLHPALAAYAHAFWPEVVHLFLLIGALWILAARRDRTAWLAALGLLLGVALLTKSLLQGFLPVILVAVAVAKPWRRALAHASLVAAFVVATVAPTVLSNYAREGVPVIADSARFNLWLGLTDESPRDRLDSSPRRLYLELHSKSTSFRERERILEERIRAFVAEQGVATILGRQLSRQYFRFFDKDSLLTDQLPGGVFAGAGRGYGAAPGWLVAPMRWASWAVHAAVLAAFPLGLVLFSPGHRPWAWTALAFVAYNLLIFLFLHVKSRYFLQVLPCFVLFAGPALERLHRDPRAFFHELPPARALAALLAAVLLLFLAFGGACLG